MTDKPYRFFRVRLTAISDLTPSFRRFTFTGDDLDDYGDPGFDQRIKLIFPTVTAPLEAMPTGDDWYAQWRELPSDTRPHIRTYTTRRVRHDLREVDVDMVVHDVTGPASQWIDDARIGDELLILAPSTAATGVSFGIDFVPPERTDAVLLVGDETAAPAIAVILEQLPPEARGHVVLELPEPADAAYMPTHPGFGMSIGHRTADTRHDFLTTTVPQVAERLAPGGTGADVEEIDIDTQLLWEVPRTAKGGAALMSAPLYAWLAGEAGGIKALRRHLVSERGVDRRAVAFMGYWRLGRAEM